jgi:hypothetical protein
MDTRPGKYVGDLKTWDLPRREDLEQKVVAEFADKARIVFLDRERSEGRLHTLFLNRLRELVSVAVNEVVEYWVKGLADGNDGQFPEFCVELPYLERGENTDSLTLAYCVDNEDGTRTELNRVTLEGVMERILDNVVSPPDLARLEMVSGQLRALARTIEQRAVAAHF